MNLFDISSLGVATKLKFKLYFSEYSSHFFLINSIILSPNFWAFSDSPWCSPVKAFKHSASPIKPIDKEMIVKCAKETEKLISIEDHSVIGGLGSAISEVLTEEYPVRLDRMGIKDTFGKSGKAEELMEYFEITAKDIVKKFWIDVRHVHQESL